MAAVEWGSINMTYASDARITTHIFNQPIVLYNGALKKFKSDKKYFEITIDGACKDMNLIKDILSDIDGEHDLRIRDTKYKDAVITGFDYDYWRTSEGVIWYKFRLTFVSGEIE